MSKKFGRHPSVSAKILTDHHRRPRSIGGTNAHANRIDVPQEIHRAWHDVVTNLCAPEIAKVLHACIAVEGARVFTIRRPNPLYNFLCPQNGKCCISWYKKREYVSKKDGWRQKKSWLTKFVRRPLKKRRLAAWQNLRKLIAHEIRDDSLDAIIKYINDFLIDSDYYLQLKRV